MPQYVILILTALTSFLVCLVLGPFAIKLLHDLKFGQSIRDEGPSSHLKKAGTPTMGGVLIIIALLAGLATGWMITRKLNSEVFSPALWLVLFLTLGNGLTGFIDDLIIIVAKRSLGLKARQKLFLQILFAAVTVYFLIQNHFPTSQLIPFYHQQLVFDPHLAGQLAFFGFAVFMLVGFSNAVNLTDGLDGLAAGTTAVAFLAFCILAVLQGQPGLAIFAAALTGACFGFTWFNGPPAQVFMGDTGSLALGAALGGIALFSQVTFFLLVIGGIFVAETLSVIIQVTSFKMTGNRVFRMSPLHHHFELGGMVESKIMIRFWMVGIVLSSLGILGYLLK